MRRAKSRGRLQPLQKGLSRRSASKSDKLYSAALRHVRAGRYQDAQTCCEQAVAAAPTHADALHLMGTLSLQSKRLDQAVEWLTRAIRQDPRPEFLSSLGATLQCQARHTEALQVFDKAVQLKPDGAELWRKLGNALADANRPADAVLSLQQALKLDPSNWDAAEKCGIVLHGLGRFEEAYACFNRCDELRPNVGLTLYMRGRCLSDLQRFDEALVDCGRAQSLEPANADIRNAIGMIFQELCRHDKALSSFDEAIALRPDFIEALNNKGASLGHFHRYGEALASFEQVLRLQPAHAPALVNKALMLAGLHRFDEAIAIHDRVKAIDPENAVAEYNLSHFYLLTGRFEAGWAALEAKWRGRSRPARYPDFAEPKWLGQEAIEGKTVLIYGDEGLGDSIQFARYAPMVAARGARIVLVVGRPLCPLLAGLPGVIQCLPKPLNETVDLDFHCPISSLPLIFKTRLDTIPSNPYLPSIPEDRIRTWEDRLGPHDKLRVGLAWSGNPTQKNDHNRSTSFGKFSRLLDCNAVFVSLQREPRAEDKAALSGRSDIVDLTEHLTDFVETAALISCLDLIITVDTSVAHLAGALRRPTWVLLCYTPDFRWLLDRDDSPWYPGMRLFRQSESRDYDSVVERVRVELHALIDERLPIDA
jgi:tetratricopeptide (TPR) repeat protein